MRIVVARALAPLSLTLVLAGLAGPAAAGLLQPTSITRTYSGGARATNSSFQTTFNPLVASATGTGDLGALSVFASASGATAGAFGNGASALLAEPSGSESILTVATATSASHRTAVPLVFQPSGGTAIADVAVLGTIDLAHLTTPTNLLLTSSLTRSGDSNSGQLRITSSTAGSLLDSPIDALPSALELVIAPGSVLTLDLTLRSNSFRGPGPFTNTTYFDSDSQSLTLGLTAVPEPSALLLAATGLVPVMLVAPRRRRGGGR